MNTDSNFFILEGPFLNNVNHKIINTLDFPENSLVNNLIGEYLGLLCNLMHPTTYDKNNAIECMKNIEGDHRFLQTHPILVIELITEMSKTEDFWETIRV